jgi:hypothetical protein
MGASRLWVAVAQTRAAAEQLPCQESAATRAAFEESITAFRKLRPFLGCETQLGNPLRNPAGSPCRRGLGFARSQAATAPVAPCTSRTAQGAPMFPPGAAIGCGTRGELRPAREAVAPRGDRMPVRANLSLHRPPLLTPSTLAALGAATLTDARRTAKRELRLASPCGCCTSARAHLARYVGSTLFLDDRPDQLHQALPSEEREHFPLRLIAACIVLYGRARIAVPTRG